MNFRRVFRRIGCLTGLALLSAVAAAAGQSTIVVTDTSPALADFTIYRPVDMGVRSEPTPVIVWGNGGCSLNQSRWLPIISRLARAGYLVLAAGAPDGPPDRTTPPEQRRRYTDEDLKRAVDWAFAANESGDTTYVGQLDTDRIALAGNSCGGITSTALASRDDRIRSIFILSGGSIGPMAKREEKAAIMNTVKAPLMYVVGGKEDFAHDPASVDYELIPSGVGMLIVARYAGDHGFVSVTPQVVTNAAEMAVNWFAGTLLGNKAALRELTTTICDTCEPGVWRVQKHKNLGLD